MYAIRDIRIFKYSYALRVSTSGATDDVCCSGGGFAKSQSFALSRKLLAQFWPYCWWAFWTTLTLVCGGAGLNRSHFMYRKYNADIDEVNAIRFLASLTLRLYIKSYKMGSGVCSQGFHPYIEVALFLTMTLKLAPSSSITSAYAYKFKLPLQNPATQALTETMTHLSCIRRRDSVADRCSLQPSFVTILSRECADSLQRL